MLQKFFIFFILAIIYQYCIHATVEGYWTIEKYPNTLIHIYVTKQKKLQGELISINYNSLFAFDFNNEDENNKKRSLLGLKLFSGFSQKHNNLWKDGKIYNPQDGKSYNAIIKLIDTNQIKLKGYVLTPLFSRSMLLKRYENPLEILKMAYEVYNNQYLSIKPTQDKLTFSQRENAFYFLGKLQASLLEHSKYFEKKYLDLKFKKQNIFFD